MKLYVSFAVTIWYEDVLKHFANAHQSNELFQYIVLF